MRTIDDLKKMYDRETSLLKKVYIYSTIKKYEKKIKNQPTLEEDLLNMMNKDSENNDRRNSKYKRKI